MLDILGAIGNGLLAFLLNLLTNPSLLEVLIPLIIIPLAFRLFPWLKARESRELNELLHAAAGRAVRAGLIASGVTTQEDLENPSVRDRVLGAAATYMTEKMPDTLNRAGVSTNKTLIDILEPHLPFPFNTIVGIGGELIESIDRK